MFSPPLVISGTLLSFVATPSSFPLPSPLSRPLYLVLSLAFYTPSYVTIPLPAERSFFSRKTSSHRRLPLPCRVYRIFSMFPLLIFPPFFFPTRSRVFPLSPHFHALVLVSYISQLFFIALSLFLPLDFPSSPLVFPYSCLFFCTILSIFILLHTIVYLPKTSHH